MADSLGIGGDFTPEGLKQKQVSGVLADVKRATGGDIGKIKTLFNGRQGGLGVAALTGMGAETYANALNNPRTGTKAAEAGKTDTITPAYNDQMNQPAQKVAALKGKIASNAATIGESFNKIFITALPMIAKFTDSITKLLTAVTKLPAPVQQAIFAFGAFKLLTAFLPMLSGFGLLTEKTTVLLGGLGKALFGIGPAAEGGAALISGPLLAGLLAVAGGVALLALAWSTDFGHIREVTAKVAAEVKGFITSQFGYVVKWFQTNLPLIREVVKVVLTTMQEFWHAHGQRIMAIINPLWSLIKTVFSAALHIIGAAVKLAMDVMTGHWGAAAKDIGVIVTNLWAVVRSLFQNGVKIVGNTLGLIVDLVLDFGKRLFEGMLNAGQQAINGIVGGIKSGIGKVVNAAKTLASSIPVTVATHLEMHSPSRVMHKMGQNTAQGLADGITAGKSTVTAAMRGVVEAALKETNSKRATLLINHEARSLRAGGMAASDVADFRESAKAAVSEQGKSGHAAKTLIPSGRMSQAMRLYAEQIKRQTQTRAAIHDALATMQDDPGEPSPDKQKAAATDKYHADLKGLGYDASQPLIYTKSQMEGFAAAKRLLDKTLAGIQATQDAKTAAATADVQADIDRLNDKTAEDKHPYDFQRDQAQKKYGTDGTEIKAGADPAKTAEALRLALKAVDDEEITDTKAAADRKQQYLVSTNQITLADYRAYLAKRKGDYQDYSAEWVQISQSLNDIDLQIWKQQEDALKRKFDQGLIDLKDYIAQMKALEATLPKTASPDEKASVDDQIAKLGGQEKRKDDREMVGGDDFWKGMAGSAADNGSHILTALLHPKDKKQIFEIDVVRPHGQLGRRGHRSVQQNPQKHDNGAGRRVQSREPAWSR